MADDGAARSIGAREVDRLADRAPLFGLAHERTHLVLRARAANCQRELGPGEMVVVRVVVPLEPRLRSRRHLLERTNFAYAKLRRNKKAWQAWQAELRQLDATLSDGI